MNLLHPLIPSHAHRKTLLLPFAFLALSLALAACGAGTFTKNPAETPTPTPISIVSIGLANDESAPNENDEDPTDSQKDSRTESSFGVAPCLPGVWSIDPDSLASYLEEQMNISPNMSIEIKSVEGDLELTFSPAGETTYSARDLQILAAISGLAEVNVVLQGEGIASYAAVDSLLATWDHTLVNTAEGKGTTADRFNSDVSAVLLLTPDRLFLGGKSENLTITMTDVPADAVLTPYACSGDRLTLNPDDAARTSWVRMPQDDA